MVVFVQNHGFCDKNIGYVYFSLPVIFCGSLAMAVQGSCRGVQRKAKLGWCAMLGLMLTMLLSSVYLGVC
jgi:hypothetical protein